LLPLRAALASARKIQLEWRSAGDVPFRGDEELLRRLVVNLLDNAIRYSPPGGRVSAVLEAMVPDLRIRVADTGMGIAPHAAAHVLHPAHDGSDSLKKTGCDFMRTRLRIGISLLVVLLVVGVGVVLGPKKFDHALAVFVLGPMYIVGSAALVLKGLVSRPEERWRIFNYGGLSLLPASWRRWMLDEKEPPLHR